MGRGGELGQDFGRVWFATGATATGAQIAHLALPLLAVLWLHASPWEVGLLSAAQWLPFLLIALPLGVLVDRRRRRPLLVVAECVRAVATVAIILCGAADLLTLPLLVLLAFLTGCGTVLFDVAYQSLLPSIVLDERLDAANSRLQATEATAVVAGPGVGGLLVQLLGALPTLGVTAAGSLLSAVSLSRVEEAFEPDARRDASMSRDLLEGARFLRHDRVLAGLLGFSAISNPFAQWVMLLFLVDAVQRLHLAPGHLGLVIAVGAGGTLLGAATSQAITHRIGPLRTIVLTSAVDPVALFVLPAAEPGWGGPALLAALGAAFAINGYAIGVDTVVVTTIRQRRTPDALRGRVNATNRLVSYGSIALGAALGGVAGELLGVRLGLLVGCVGALVTITWVLGWAALVTRHGDRLDGSPVAAVELTRSQD